MKKRQTPIRLRIFYLILITLSVCLGYAVFITPDLGGKVVFSLCSAMFTSFFLLIVYFSHEEQQKTIIYNKRNADLFKTQCRFIQYE